MAISTTTKKPLSLPLLAFITTYLTLFHNMVHSADTVSFSFNTFEANPKDLIFQGNASIPSGSNAVQLTVADSRIQRAGTVGRVLYSAPIRLWADSAVLASFETTFTFSISRPGNNPPADGLAFFLAAPDTTIPPNSDGGQLGLFSSSLAINNSRNEIVGFKASPDQVVAVEFDTYINPALGDPKFKHIGIDVNSISSVVTAAWDWQNGGTATAHISYNSVSGTLSAVTYYPNSKTFTVHYDDVKLNEVLPEWVRVGFSASTGDYSQQTTLLSWSFSSSLKRKDVAGADDGYIASVV